MGSRGAQPARGLRGTVLAIGVSMLVAACERAASPVVEPATAPPATVDLPAPAPPPLPAPAAQPTPEPAAAPEPAPTGPQPRPQPPIDPTYALSCDGPFGPDTTLADLRARFGAGNVVEEAILGPEASEWDGAVVFPDDPARRIEIVWDDVTAKRGVASALVYDEASVWSGPGGLRIGDGLAAVEAANGGTFVLYGFEWDFGGVVSDWLGGLLFDDGGGRVCNVQIRFGVTDAIDPELAISVAGDAPFASDDPNMRAAAPVVQQLGIGFARAG